jgi:hypothetical protein
LEEVSWALSLELRLLPILASRHRPPRARNLCRTHESPDREVPGQAP